MLSAVGARRRAERRGCLSARSRYCAFTQCRPRSLQETSCKENRRGRAGSGGPTRTLLHRHRQVNDARLGLSALVVYSSLEPSRAGPKQTYCCVWTWGRHCIDKHSQLPGLITLLRRDAGGSPCFDSDFSTDRQTASQTASMSEVDAF